MYRSEPGEFSLLKWSQLSSDDFKTYMNSARLLLKLYFYRNGNAFEKERTVPKISLFSNKIYSNISNSYSDNDSNLNELKVISDRVEDTSMRKVMREAKVKMKHVGRTCLIGAISRYFDCGDSTLLDTDSFFQKLQNYRILEECDLSLNDTAFNNTNMTGCFIVV